MRMLSIRISSLRVCSACASETKCGVAPSKILILSEYFYHQITYPGRPYSVKNQENPSDRISHAWAPLNNLLAVTLQVTASVRSVYTKIWGVSCDNKPSPCCLSPANGTPSLDHIFVFGAVLYLHRRRKNRSYL